MLLPFCAIGTLQSQERHQVENERQGDTVVTLWRGALRALATSIRISFTFLFTRVRGLLIIGPHCLCMLWNI